MASIFLIGIVLLFAGGLIAFLGDWLGTYVGKKRLSLLKLRPRHTAMIYTIISGSLIAISTFAAVLTIDGEAREALTRWQQTLHDNHVLTAQNEKLRLQTASLQNDRDSAYRQAAEAKSQQHDAEVGKQMALDAEAKDKRDLLAAQSNLAASKAAVIESSLALAASRRRLQVVEADVTAKASDLAAAKGEVLAEQAKEDRAENSLKLAQAAVDKAQAQRIVLTATNNDLKRQNTALAELNQHYTSGAMIYRAGTDFGHLVISTSDSSADVRKKLDSWLEDLSSIADRHGAARGPNGREVAFAPPENLGLSESEALDNLAQIVTSQSGIFSTVVVAAYAKTNTLVGQQVKLELRMFDNKLSITKGTVVAATSVDGSQPYDSIAAAMQHFLADSVRSAADGRGIMATIDPDSGNGQYGIVVDENGNVVNGWGDIIQRIQAAGASAVVVAKAYDDAYTSGPLQVTIDVSGDASTVTPGPTSSAATAAVAPSQIAKPDGHSPPVSDDAAVSPSAPAGSNRPRVLPPSVGSFGRTAFHHVRLPEAAQ